MEIDDRYLRYIGISASWLSTIITGLVMLHSADKDNFGFESVGIILWAIAPYLGLVLGEFLMHKIKVIPKITLIFCIVSVLIFLFTLYAYVGTLGNKSSTTALIFLFIPLYLNVITVLLVMIGLIWTGVSKSNEKAVK